MPTGLRQFRKNREREESFKFIEKSAEWSEKGKVQSEREESTKQVKVRAREKQRETRRRNGVKT